MGLASKGIEQASTGISKASHGLGRHGESGGSYLYCWYSSVRLTKSRVERLQWVKSKWIRGQAGQGMEWPKRARTADWENGVLYLDREKQFEVPELTTETIEQLAGYALVGRLPGYR